MVYGPGGNPLKAVALAYSVTVCAVPSWVIAKGAAAPRVVGRSSFTAPAVRLRLNGIVAPPLDMDRLPAAKINGAAPLEHATVNVAALSPVVVPASVETLPKAMVAAPETAHAEVSVAFTVSTLSEVAADAAPPNAIEANATAKRPIFWLDINIL